MDIERHEKIISDLMEAFEDAKLMKKRTIHDPVEAAAISAMADVARAIAELEQAEEMHAQNNPKFRVATSKRDPRPGRL